MHALRGLWKRIVDRYQRRGHIEEVSAELLKATQSHLKESPIAVVRPVLLVDELEVQYRQLQRRVQSEGDRSPLRELLSRRSFLKFFALAPAGMANAESKVLNRP